jgi:hypothetical protein
MVSTIHKTDAPGPKHSSGCIFMHRRYMLWSLTRRAGPQKALSRLSEGDLCTIQQANFHEKAQLVKSRRGGSLRTSAVVLR